MNINALFVHNKLKNSRIQVTTSSTHYQAFKRSKSHRRIYTFTVLNSCDTRTITKMARNHIQFVNRFIHKSSSLFSNKLVRHTMSTISSYTIFFKILVRQSIHISFFRHCLMEACIKNQNFRYARHSFQACIDSQKCRRIMKWCIRNRFLIKSLQYFISNQSRFFKERTRIYYSMTNSSNFI